MEKQLLVQAKAVRSFGRKFTKVLGLLSEAPYDASLNLIESRIIFEVAQAKTLRAADLVRILEVDKGYLSRVLTKLKKRRLLETATSKQDHREQLLGLSTSGLELFRKIDRASSARTQTLLKSLGPSAQAFANHVTMADAALTRETFKAKDFELRGLKAGDLGWVISRNGELYAQEFGWNRDYEAFIAEILVSFVKKPTNAKERAWIAELNGTRLGCVFVMRESNATAKLRILLVEPAARGLGLGARLVNECISFARAAGYSKIVLWTNDVLVSARKIYEAQGFKIETQERHKSFGKDLVGQTWAKSL
jgi:DNA-binding MarR family transcriptional regulator/GNAT superfamily N-acetyltransferase